MLRSEAQLAQSEARFGYAARNTLTGLGVFRRFGAFFTFTSSSRSTAYARSTSVSHVGFCSLPPRRRLAADGLRSILRPISAFDRCFSRRAASIASRMSAIALILTSLSA